MLEPWSVIAAFLPGMLVLLVLSAFFAASEAGLFSLSLSERRQLHGGSTSDQVAATLLNRSDRLLMGILFWNLTVNLAYFAIASQVTQKLVDLQQQSPTAISPELFDVVAIVIVVIFAEFLPKCVAVLKPRTVVRVVSIPLAIAIRVLDSVIPALKFVNEVSRRIILPGFRPEPYLETADLDRAVVLTTGDSLLLQQEKEVLQNIIQLSDIRVEEWMHPRSQYRTLPITADVTGIDAEMAASGYLMLTDKFGREIIAAVDLADNRLGHETNFVALRQSVIIVPWCTSIADALSRLHETQRKVALIVNEFGETIGVLTFDEMIDAVFKLNPTQSHREWSRADIVPQDEDVWLATGMTSLRRLERVVGRKLSVGRNLTVIGAIQERLKRLAQVGDRCSVGDFDMQVVEAA